MKNPWVIIGVITVVLFGGAIWFSGSSAEEYNQGVEIQTQATGNLDASVVLTEYSDLQCPACASFHPVLKEILAQYSDDLRFEYKHMPLPIHQYAVQAAVAAEAAGQQGKFFEFHDKLFENQDQWSSSAVPATLFTQYAQELELDIEQFKRHSKSPLLREHVQSQFNEGRERGVTGTPSFFLNGERMQFETIQDFVEQIAIAIGPAATGASSTAPASDVTFGI